MEDGLVPISLLLITYGAEVLILVVVEDGLVLCLRWYSWNGCWVLILVVVEDGLVRVIIVGLVVLLCVLILVVVEDGLVLATLRLVLEWLTCLNPCCSGRWSRTFEKFHIFCPCWRLNPCCSGRWSRTQNVRTFANADGRVLILVVVEDGLVLVMTLPLWWWQLSLNPCCSGRWSRTVSYFVLKTLLARLNPYCSGSWSRTHIERVDNSTFCTS